MMRSRLTTKCATPGRKPVSILAETSAPAGAEVSNAPRAGAYKHPDSPGRIAARRVISGPSARHRLGLALAVSLAGLLIGCARTGGEPPPESADRYLGSVETACSPLDAMAIGFNLQLATGEELPQVSITIWPSGDTSSGERVRLNFDGAGYGAAVVSGTEWTQAVDGEIQLEHYSAGQAAGGWFWLELSDAERLEGWFEAEWLDRGPVYCG